MADSLAALGLELRADAIAWLAELTPDALPDGTQAARELLTALGALEAEVAAAAADQVELTRLQAWLTAGFHAAAPFAPADAVAAEAAEAADAAEQARRAGADGAAQPAARSAAGEIPDVERAAAAAEDPGARSMANEFAAVTTRLPPAPTASGEPIAPHARAWTEVQRSAVAAGEPGPPMDPPPAPRQPAASGLPGSGSASAARAPDPADGLPRPAGGIRGLAALAALAGRGIEITDAGEDAHPTASDRAGWAPQAGVRTADPVDADRSGAIGRPVRSAPSPAAPASEAGDRDAARIVRIPLAPRAVDDADQAWAPLPVPFLVWPGEPGDAAPRGSAAVPRGEPGPPAAGPTTRVVDGQPLGPAPDARRKADAEWAAFDEPGESAESFLSRAARLAGARVRPAAEGAGIPAPSIPPPREDFAPAARPLARLAAAAPEATRTVLAREAVPERPVDAADWPAADVTDLLDALASEIAHEYRRYYGE